MLADVCHYVHNYFEREVYRGQFTIADNTISVFGIMEGQRFRIEGSVMNDGIYTYHSAGVVYDDDDSLPIVLSNETFKGKVTLMGVEPMFLRLVDEISAWVEKYGDKVETPYQSENVIGVYSYTKASSTDAAAANGTPTWQSTFKSRLNHWRKIA